VEANDVGDDGKFLRRKTPTMAPDHLQNPTLVGQGIRKQGLSILSAASSGMIEKPSSPANLCISNSTPWRRT